MLTHTAFLFALLRAASCAQPDAQEPIAAPLRDLPWAQLNFLHTTDVHGWWGGHLQEASFSADWGDYVSFAKHLRDKADAAGVDLLVVDTGDRVEGNAIYDSSKPRGKFTYEIAKEQHIDLISSGNHELYKADTAEGEYYHTVRDFQGSYLASNLDIYDPQTGYLEPLAPRYKKFTTKNQGIRILAFGFIFDFTGNANNTVVTRVDDTIKEDWFLEALKDQDLDLIVVFGHVDIRSPEYAALFSTIRAAHKHLPIQFFGGHSHIRDYKIFDDKSVALESGRYMETLGFMSIEGLSSTGGKDGSAATPQKSDITFSRRYIDNNLFSLRHHSGKDEKTFPTEHGLNVSKAIGDARDSLGLTKKYGCAPRDLWISRRPFPHNESILSWLKDEVLPDSIGTSQRVKSGGKALVIQNTGAIRFDIFKGAYTKDTKFLVSPFTSPLRLIKDVPYKAASQVIELLNHGGPIALEMMEAGAFLQPPEVTAARFRPALLSSPRVLNIESGEHQKPMLSADPALIPGYTTHDDAGSDGDDTIHSEIAFYNVPNCMQAVVGFDPAGNDEPQTVDLMYNEFIQKWILMALQYIGQKYTSDDTEVYAQGKSFTDIMTDWVSDHWAHEGECPR